MGSLKKVMLVLILALVHLFIHCFLLKQSKRSLSFTCSSVFKHNKMEMASQKKVMLVLILALVHLFIHCFLLKQSKRSLSFTCSSVFKHNKMKMVIHSQLTKMRPSSVKIWTTQVYFSSPWDETTAKYR